MFEPARLVQAWRRCQSDASDGLTATAFGRKIQMILR